MGDLLVPDWEFCRVFGDSIDKLLMLTTNGGEREGMGLAISKEILTNYNDQIEVTNDLNFTAFEGWFPKSKNGVQKIHT